MADIILGPLALIGLIFKYFGVSSMKKSNEDKIEWVRGLRSAMSVSMGSFSDHSSTRVHMKGYQTKTLREFSLNKTSPDATYDEIETFIRQSIRHFYVTTRGTIQNHDGGSSGEIIVSFNVLEPK